MKKDLETAANIYFNNFDPIEEETLKSESEIDIIINKNQVLDLICSEAKHFINLLYNSPDEMLKTFRTTSFAVKWIKKNYNCKHNTKKFKKIVNDIKAIINES